MTSSVIRIWVTTVREDALTRLEARNDRHVTISVFRGRIQAPYRHEGGVHTRPVARLATMYGIAPGSIAVSDAPDHRTVRPVRRSWQSSVLARIAMIVDPGRADMTERDTSKPLPRLLRPLQLRPSARRRFARIALVGLGLAIVALTSDLVGRRPDRQQDCATAAGAQAWTRAVRVCQLEFDLTGVPETGRRLGDAQVRAGDLDAAKRTATQLLGTPAKSDALYLLGWIARQEGRDTDAIPVLEAARAAHRSEHQALALITDDGVLASIRMDRSQFRDALELAIECAVQARLAAAPASIHYCHTIAASALTALGYGGAAAKELEAAQGLAVDRTQRSDLIYQRASLLQEQGQHTTAIALLRQAQQIRGNTPDVRWTITLEINLAYSLAERGQPDEALRHLQIAALLDFSGRHLLERILTEARIAYRQHNMPRASELAERYMRLRQREDDAEEAADVDRDERIDVATLQARIELERGDFARAEHWARQAVEQAERVRNAQATLELRPWVLAKRREPYELLFVALARSRQVEDAVMVFDSWQGRTLQDALVNQRSTVTLDPASVARQLARLGDWLRVASTSVFAGPANRAAVIGTLRDIDLLALIVADGEVWRLFAHHGPPQLTRVALLTEIQDSLDVFRSSPTASTQAAALGALFLPDEAFNSHDLLHVLIDGRLGSVPVAALRHGATPLVAVRPIVHAVRLPEQSCVPAAAPGHVTVLTAASPTTPKILVEGAMVARLLHVTSATATRAAVFAAARDAVLHVAAHGKVGMDGASLALDDGEVSALEISARGVAPTLAVLSACEGVGSNDGELGGSLASAFLGAGSRHVVATLRPISDEAALDITTRFYQAGGVWDPPRALATVQAELARSGSADWPIFAVFGPEVCRDGAPGSE